jgi:hypothetical protein
MAKRSFLLLAFLIYKVLSAPSITKTTVSREVGALNQLDYHPVTSKVSIEKKKSRALIL